MATLRIILHRPTNQRAFDDQNRRYLRSAIRGIGGLASILGLLALIDVSSSSVIRFNRRSRTSAKIEPGSPIKGLHWPTTLAALLSPNVFFARWQTQIPVTSALAAPIYLVMLRPAYLSQKLDRPLATKDGGTLRTVLDARTYMLGLSEDRERSSRWQRAADLLLAEADVGALSKAVELALFYDAKLDVAAS